MMAIPRMSGMRPLDAARIAAAVAAVLSFTVFAQAQQAPRTSDFRYRPPAAAPAPKAGEPCDGCGVIRAIREVRSQRPIPVPKPLQGEALDRGPGSTVLVGAVVALPTGPGSSGSQPYVGGVGTPEMKSRFSETSYEIVVRFDNGGFTRVQRNDGASFQVGDRVRVRGVQMELLAP